jgi:hypothetical protein
MLYCVMCRRQAATRIVLVISGVDTRWSRAVCDGCTPQGKIVSDRKITFKK